MENRTPSGIRVLLVSALSLALLGCFGQDMRALERETGNAQTAIRQALGVDSNIGYRLFTGIRGRQLTVFVHLKSLPPKLEAAEVKRRVEECVRAAVSMPELTVSVTM